ncbi:MAG: hypothetical protein A2508_10050 [Candidatus Lambdaproteobacteria bacterium RIFOXYD12_FULL_49_8]|uniref:Uncharacterized protein n=1 Tax=Candidatus Lambdaproteobacteria bacterium RIFOXYD2_FULL_50_16 TaxID=1817772 RepID=A0A1F6GA06_9PROT|nr:MAG: hypothetical protein A3K03_12640 [Bdellovibrionales bacterium RIFOXYD1_FULL_44_7]OGG94942.1 MAG: hypothetical protein A2527_06275 [Candidatus Lambdaproteobacteria bacterium RIFOXYD2_FULL_50_16]OGG97841.1 MAG: hypothetical protein A2508_10050 [Candidatus Lambdaproteobacteria bacterium RIFOXYD12_FULL_49_8]
MDLFIRFFSSKAFRLFLRLLGTVASAIFLLQGFLFLQNLSKNNKELRQDPAPEDLSDQDEPKDSPKKNVLFFKN